MRTPIHSFFRFSTTEKWGIAALIVVAVLLLASLWLMPNWVNQEKQLQEDTVLQAAWMAYKDKQQLPEEENNTQLSTPRKLFAFDPNVLDSVGFIALGLRAKQVHLLLNWRRKGKIFYKKEDFQRLYTLSDAQYQELAPYIDIATTHSTPGKTTFRYDPEPEQVDVNTTDMATLVRLRGIGPFYAQKILDRRKALGGYIKHEQLLEAYRFPDSTYDMLKRKLIIQSSGVHKINLNTASEEELKAHPYIGAKYAAHIIIYRESIHQFEKIEQLKQVPLMNEENYRKIAPYLSID